MQIMILSNSFLSEKERNKRLLLLLQDLIEKNDSESIELLKTMVMNDTPSMQKSFEIITSSLEEQQPNPFFVQHFSHVVRFSSLNIGDEFECYGDESLNYNYPKIYRCIKYTERLGKEKGTNLTFYMSDSDKVTIDK